MSIYKIPKEERIDREIDCPVPIGQYEWEFRKLYEIYTDLRPAYVLEIGTHSGGTLFFWSKFTGRYSKIAAVDDQHINESLYSQWGNIDCIKGDSHSDDIKNRLRENYRFFDFIFIDGDHSYEGVKEDWELALEFKPLIVAFHDITPHPHRGVDKLWREIQAEGYKTQEIIGNEEWPDQCGIGVVWF